ncbi:MAG: argininosuccinate lyase [Chloroflexota bacterium]
MTLWGGRFSGKLDEYAWALNTSLPVDQRMAIQDVDGSIAWASALLGSNILNQAEYQQIIQGLSTVRQEFSNGEFLFAPADEDIHTAVERRLTELIGAPAWKLHTGRSRNDQVATDFRLWMLATLPSILEVITNLQSVLINLAETAGETLMPGYTHLQRAQPVLLAHWWLSHFWPLERDKERLESLVKRVSILPLGCGALAGTPIDVDRAALAVELGFAYPSPNSMDAVSDRDFAAEFLFCASMLAVHLSKLAEQIVLFTSAEFGFLELSDAFSTGSSLMPQKKNPDVFELTRGKAGTLLGLLTGLMASLKGLPSTYDKDLQEDKAPVFAAADTILMMLPVLSGALQSISIKSNRMRAAIDSFMMATDLADYLVGKGIPFRETHSLAGKAVRLALDQGVGLDGLSMEQYKSLHVAFEPDVYSALDPMESVKRRNAYGGTAPEAVHNQILLAKKVIKGE